MATIRTGRKTCSFFALLIAVYLLVGKYTYVYT